MIGKELVIKTLQHSEGIPIPWIPFAGVHAGRLVGYDAREVLTDPDKLAAALQEVHRLYQPDGMPVLFDLQIEAEILGCELLWADKAPASVVSHPCIDKSIPAIIPTAQDGRLPLVLKTLQRIKPTIGRDTALFGLISGPFTLASHLRGNELFMDMFDDPAFVRELMVYTTVVVQAMTDIYINAGFDVIAIVDPLVSQISPDHFNEFFAGSFTDVFTHIREKGVPSSFFVCGNATRNIEAMCKTGPDSIFVDENVDLKHAKAITDRYHITIGGNIPLTSVMLHGTQQDNMKYVVELIDSLGRGDLCIAPGCDMPYDTPPENTIAVQQAIRETKSVREMIRYYETPEDDTAIEIPDYRFLEKPLIEVFTLDSATCAACTYMMGAALRCRDSFLGKVDIVEYKFTEKESIARVRKMGVKHLPSIYINGELKFSSIIPSHRELCEAVEVYLK